MAQTIVSNTGALVRNGGVATVPKGGYTVSISEDFVYVESGSIKWKLDYKDTTVDGSSFASAKELAVALSNFSKGGGDGQGVTISDVENYLKSLPGFAAGASLQANAAGDGFEWVTA